MKIFWMFAAIPAALYVVLMVFFTVFQSALVYYPRRDWVSTPDETGLDYENVLFETEDNIKLSGWFFPSKASGKVVLFCHGNAGNISHGLETIQIFNRIGANVFIFDYRGYGKSAGKPSELGTYRDMDAAWKYLTENRKVPPKDIIVFGRSLGGAVAAWAAEKKNPGALVLESTFTSIPDIGSEAYPIFPVRALSRFKYDTLGRIRNIRCPVLVIHSTEDEMIPYRHGRKIYEMANDPKYFYELKGTHNDGFMSAGDRYREIIGKFISLKSI